jgi:predicted RNA binding protein YcfA (HicA-like mRNA interferase family)
MPKVPRDVSHYRLVRFLLKRGWQVVREGAKHTVVSKGDDSIAIPRHGVLKTGLVAKILKQANIAADDSGEL